MPIKGESFQVLKKGVARALGYLEEQSDATWGQSDSDPERAEVITFLRRASDVIMGEESHIAEVERRRTLREIAKRQSDAG